MQTDNGTKFLNAMFQRMLTNNNIHWYNMENEDITVGIVKCFNRMLKTKMSRYFTFKNGPYHTDVLQKLIDSYNVTYHHSIDMSPNEVNANNKDLVQKWLYPLKRAR